MQGSEQKGTDTAREEGRNGCLVQTQTTGEKSTGQLSRVENYYVQLYVQDNLEEGE